MTSAARPRNRSALAACGFLAAALAMPSLCARAAEPAPTLVIESAQLGFSGVAKVGFFAPLRVSIANQGAAQRTTVHGTVVDGDGVPVTAVKSAELAAAKTTAVELYVKPGRSRVEVKIEVLDGDRVVAARTLEPAPLLPSGTELLVLFGPAFEFQIEGPPQARAASRAVSLGSAADFPAAWCGYEGVDAVVLSTSDPKPYAALDRTRIAALEQYVRSGGKLIVLAGSGTQLMFAGDGPLARFSPGTLRGTATLRDYSALESYVESGDRLEPILQGKFADFHPVAPRFEAPRGIVEVAEGSGSQKVPLIVRTPFGFGQVVVGAFDLDRPPLRSWSGGPRLFELLLARSSSFAETQAVGQGQVATLGYTDLVGQAHSALEQFPGVQHVPFALIAGLTVVYIALVGPLDYLLLRKVLRRMELTWITFPLIVLVFCGGAWAIARGFKGNELLLNQLDIVDLDSETGLLRGTSLARLFSPATRDFDLRFVPRGVENVPAGALASRQVARKIDPPIVMSWLGLPGDSFGGIDASLETAPLLDTPYRQSEAMDQLEHVPVSIWSTKGVEARWFARHAPTSGIALVDEGEAVLTGEIANPFSVDLEDCVVLYEHWVYAVGKLERGRRARVSGDVDAQTAETYFRHLAGRGDKDINRPYDRSTLDLGRIAEMLMFHDAAGGRNYTGLAHRYHAFLDLSDQLRLGRAVLLGSGPAPAAELQDRGRTLADEHRTCRAFYRIVLPVRQSGPSGAVPGPNSP